MEPTPSAIGLKAENGQSSHPSRTLRRLLRAMHLPGIGVSAGAIHVLAEAARRTAVHVTDLDRRLFEGRRRVYSYLYQLEHAGYVTWDRERVGSASGVIAVTGRGRELLRALARVVEGQ
jgi:DNA-binding MarR family transcriptional regulator